MVAALLAVVLVLVVAGCGDDAVGRPDAAETRCAATVANGSVPPGERGGAFHHGNRALWTVLPGDGRVVGLADMADLVHPAVRRSVGNATFGSLGRGGSTSAKFPWWWGGSGPKPRLTITGERLDGLAAPLRLDGTPGSGEPDFWASGIVFPTAGCWRVTGAAGDASLTFVVRVVALREVPAVTVSCSSGGPGAVDRTPGETRIGPLRLVGARQTVHHRRDAFGGNGYKVPVTLAQGSRVTLSVPRTARRRAGLVFTHDAQDRAFRSGVRGAERAVTFAACATARPGSRTGWPGGFVVDRPRCVTLELRGAGSRRVLRGRVPLGRPCPPSRSR